MPREPLPEKAPARVEEIPVLDLFAGYGGASLALEAAGGFRTIGFSEIADYPSALLAYRWPGVPNLGLVQSVTPPEVLRRCGQLPAVVTGGFPCQPHSLAGKRLAAEDDRDLWDECCRVLREFRPRFALFENVPGLLTSEGFTDAADGGTASGLFFNRVLSDLASIRYACLWTVLSAAELGASHGRDRVWLLCLDELADPADFRCGLGPLAPGGGDFGREAGHDQAAPERDGRGRDHVADPDHPGFQGTVRAREHAHEQREEPGMGITGSGGGDGAEGGAVAHADGVGGLQDSEPGQLRAERIEQPSGYRWPARSAERPEEPEWPARDGLWPAKAWSPPFGWEAPRVITEAQPPVGRDADGTAARAYPAPREVSEAPDTVNRAARIRALGNGIVPSVAYPFAVAMRRYFDGELTHV